jgi:hypothetical protein
VAHLILGGSVINVGAIGGHGLIRGGNVSWTN